MAAASLDIMNDVVLKFGHMLGNEQTQLKSILLQGLVDPKPVIRKRAVNCLGMATIHNRFQGSAASRSSANCACYSGQGRPLSQCFSMSDTRTIEAAQLSIVGVCICSISGAIPLRRGLGADCNTYHDRPEGQQGQRRVHACLESGSGSCWVRISRLLSGILALRAECRAEHSALSLGFISMPPAPGLQD